MPDSDENKVFNQQITGNEYIPETAASNIAPEIAEIAEKQDKSLVIEKDEENMGRYILNLFSSGYSYDTDKGFDLYETAKDLSTLDEKLLYDSFEKEFLNNDFAFFLVTNLASVLMDYRFESDNPKDLKTVKDFFYMKETENHLHQFLINAFLYGTGIAQRFIVNEELRNFVRVDASTIEIRKRRLNDGTIEYDYIQVNTEEDVDEFGRIVQIMRPTQLRSKHIAAFRPIELPNRAHGISMMRGSLLSLQALRQLNFDIPVGIKKLAYNSMRFAMDLEGIGPEKQADVLKKMSKSFQKYDSATNTVWAFDKKHELKYIGTDGGSQASIIPLLNIVEPILVFLLNKWFIPLGDVLQEKSNRALAQTQTETSRRRLEFIKKKFAKFLERELISYILGKPDEVPTVRVIHNAALSERVEEAELLLSMYEKGALSLETLHQLLGIHDSGTTFNTGIDTPVEPAPSPDSNKEKEATANNSK